jgi:hypothetical protein
MNSKKKKLPLKKLSLIAYREIKSARNTQEKSQSYWAVILKLFHEETERSITDSTLRRIVKYEKKIISKERYSAELIKFRGNYLNKNCVQIFETNQL